MYMLLPSRQRYAILITCKPHAKADSERDILILLEKPVILKDEQVFRPELFELELIYGEPISVFVYSKDDWNGKQEATLLTHHLKAEGNTK